MYRVIVALCCVLVVSCATNSTIPRSSPPQEVKITIDSNKPVEIAKDCEERITRAMEVRNPEGQLSFNTFISGDKAFIKIFSGIITTDQTNLWNDFMVLENNTNIREVHIFISSPGGSAFDGLGVADQIERAKSAGFKIIGHASGIIASAAVPIFAVCNKRIAASGTIFMVHESSMFKFGVETASDVRAQNELMELLRDRYMAKLVKYSALSRERWEELERKTTWFNAEQAVKWGLVDEIN